MKKLWDHQERALTEAAKHFAKGALAGCIVMGTGSGKTLTGGAAVRRHLDKKPEGKVLWVAHREELVSQPYDALTEDWDLDCGVIQANPTRPVNPHRRVQIASVQTLIARPELFAQLVGELTFGVWDECHHFAGHNKWVKPLHEMRGRKIPLLGLTATPIRGDGHGFENEMDFLVCPITVKELIASGTLVPFELQRPGRRLKSDQIAQNPVKAYRAHAAGRKAIVFAANIKAAHEYAQEFNSVGIPAATVWGEMDGALRRRTLDDYKAGRLTVLTNVGVLTEGFDDRATSCVILARSVGTLSLYLQICGRALRADPESGKTDAVIIDLHGTSHDPEFGRPDDDREWTLEGDGVKHKGEKVVGPRLCIVCKEVQVESGGNVCEFCGFVRPEAVAPEVLNLPLEKYAAKRREPEHVRLAYFQRMRELGRQKGYSPWWAFQKYKAIYGEKVPRQWLSS